MWVALGAKHHSHSLCCRCVCTGTVALPFLAMSKSVVLTPLQNGAVAIPSGSSEGLDAGDTILFQFNQPVFPVSVSTKAAVDALLQFQPSTWALSYSGVWVDQTSLLIRVDVYVFASVPSRVVSA